MDRKKTFIKGKDRELEYSIETMLLKLKNFGIEIEEVSWLNPVVNVYSVHIRDKDCPYLFTNGKGSCEKSTLASALGEFLERLSCNYFFADYYLGAEFSNASFVHYPNEKWFEISGAVMPEGLLDEDLWEYYDPEYELMPQQIADINSDFKERGICALPFKRLRDGASIYFPVNIIGNLYVSNGMAAGNTVNEARVQALSEIFERYVKNKIISEGICLPEIPHAILQRYPKILAALESLKSHGYHLRIADASLGGVYPVISVTLINPKEGSVFASFGAHPCFEVALERTVTELLQGRDAEGMNDFLPPTFNMDEVADNNNLVEHFINSSGLISYDFFKKDADFEFADWDFDSATQSEFAYLSEIIHDMGLDIYIADYEHLDVYACRIIVPKMSEIYPVQDLLWSNNNQGVFLREAVLSLHSLCDDELQELLDTLENGSFEDMQKVAELVGIIPDAKTVWAELKIGELKAMLALALKDYELALEWNNWCLYMGGLDEKRLALYRTLHAFLEIELDGQKDAGAYEYSLSLMYSAENVRRAKALIGGDERFYGLDSPGLALDGFVEHKKLLDAYLKVHLAKQKKK
ncbi:YcaO-like family protein [bacterium]|nr:YcaO-like family protein [bacterium]MBU1991257.1 YcaO-like family protein [bacterium]